MIKSVLHPQQVRAIEKLKCLKVGALYIDRQDGKLRTVLELIDYRIKSGRIDGVIWLCTRRKSDMLWEGVCAHAPELAPSITLKGIEGLSFSINAFLALMDEASSKRVMLVIDNGLLIKNVGALRTQRVLALSERCPYRLMISDVPLARSLADMYAPWRALDWRILGYSSYWGFAVNHLGRGRRARNAEYLARAVEPYCAQVMREDVQQVGGREEFVWQFRLPGAARAEYDAVAARFMRSAVLTRTGVYRLLHACQAVTSGRSVIGDYPLATRPMYAAPEQNPRIQALMDVLCELPERPTLVLCRYRQDCQDVGDALALRYGERGVRRYLAARDGRRARFTVMNIFTDERERARLSAGTIIYYSCDWNWRKRAEKERQCLGALDGGRLTVVSLAAADTIDVSILRCIWSKDNMVRLMQEELRAANRSAGEQNAQDIH